MKIGLIDLDSKIPNLALMKISAYHRAMGDVVSLGERGELTYISCVFSKNKHRAKNLLDQCSDAVVGGPGWDHAVTLTPEIESKSPDYSLYGINYGIGRLTIGCPGNCPWCVVPIMEGSNPKTVATSQDIVNPSGKHLVLLDANILACSDWIEHFRDIRERGLSVNFTQGLDIRYVNDLVSYELAKLKIKSLHEKKGRIYFAWDKPEIEEHVRRGIDYLSNAGIKKWRIRFYVLVGYNTTWEQDWHRFRILRDLGVEPFIMCYQGSSPKLRAFAGWVNKRIYHVCSWDEYHRWNRIELAEMLS